MDNCAKNEALCESSLISNSSTPSNESNEWDDSLLIVGYDKSLKKIEQFLDSDPVSILSVKNESPSSFSKPSQSKSIKSENNWKKGDFCRALFSEDNLDYEAIILDVNLEENTCLVKYLGYDNQESQSLNQLKSSKGQKARKLQKQEALTFKQLALNDKQHYETHELTDNNKSFILPPPPPPSFITCKETFQKVNQETSLEDSALSSMLMSWYMSGYHTGYYQAIKQFKCSKG